jgi:hypothetical protein
MSHVMISVLLILSTSVFLATHAFDAYRERAQ